MSKIMKDWSQKELLEWFKDLNNAYTETQKKEIIAGIKKFGAKGSDVWNAEKDDLKEAFEITGLLASKLATDIAKQRSNDLPSPPPNPTDEGNNNNDSEFTLNILGSKPTKLGKIKSSYSIGYVKKEYLTYYGQKITTTKMKGVNIKYLGEPLNDNDRTLKSYGIINGDGIQLFITYNLNGGMSENKLNDEDDADNYRFRKLRYKKYKSIKLSKKPDIIYGPIDGVKTAEMPCGCAIAADTMFNYMKSVFDKDLRAIKSLICPQLKSKCTGNDIQRQWKWQLVFCIADLSEKEILKYSLIIQNRISGTKSCPNCNALCEKPENVKIWRVRCSNCNKRDWCFQCSKFWIGSGLTFCGNNECVADSLELCLKNTKWIEPKYSATGWTKGISVPQTRACPNCYTLIEYGEKCQHMTCVVCPHQFCFKCLAIYSKDTGYSCKPSKCSIHPIQKKDNLFARLPNFT